MRSCVHEIDLDDTNLPELKFLYLANGLLLPAHFPASWSNEWITIAKGLAETHEWWIEGGGWFSFRMIEPADVLISICFLDEVTIY